MIARLVWLSAAIAAAGAAAAVAVFSIAFAIYALLEPHLGRAGAAGAEVGVFAVIVALAAFVASQLARFQAPKRRPMRERERLALADKALGLVQEKPFAAAGIAVGVGLLAVANPKLFGGVARSFIQGWQGRKEK